MERIVAKISSYIEYLRTQGLVVSIHFTAESINKLPYRIWKHLLPYNSHDNPYCISVKACSAESCLAHQHAILDKMTNDQEIFECYAGVKEYVFRIPHGSATVGYIAVSGYKSERAPLLKCGTQFMTALSAASIPTELCDTLIPPLAIMLTRLFEMSDMVNDNEYNMISQYLAENHTTLDFDNLCRHFSRSRSYMSHTFKKTFGVSFSEYCNNLRLADAKRLLIVTDLPVTEIALSCGFEDVSYFIRLFRNKYALTPLQYRKKNIKN